jgi:hypothetical protein
VKIPLRIEGSYDMARKAKKSTKKVKTKNVAKRKVKKAKRAPAKKAKAKKAAKKPAKVKKAKKTKASTPAVLSVEGPLGMPIIGVDVIK